MVKSYILLKPSNELTNSPTEIETHDFQDGTPTLQLSIKGDPPKSKYDVRPGISP